MTLARLKTKWPRSAVDRFREAAAAAAPAFPAWPVRSCVLFASRLDPRGAVHTPIAEWPFGHAGVAASAAAASTAAGGTS